MYFSQTTFSTRACLFTAKCILLLTASTAFADTATTVFCFFPNQAPVTGASACAVNGPPDLSGFSGVQASSLVTFSLGDTAGDFADLHFTQSAIARAPLGTPYFSALPLTVSSASLDNLLLKTVGTERSGFVEVVYAPAVTVTPEGITGNYSISLGGIPTVSCELVGVTSADSCQQYAINFASHLFQFDLGTQFTLNFSGLITAFGNPDNNFASGYTDVNYRFRFLESDGVTPAAVAVITPEPAAWTLVLLAGSIGLLVWYSRRKTQH